MASQPSASTPTQETPKPQEGKGAGSAAPAPDANQAAEPAAPAPTENKAGGADEPAWAKKSMRKRCECEMCLSGKATTHNDESHDQALDQKLSVAGLDLRIIGGTTKCARVMVKFFEGLYKEGSSLKDKTVVEVGSGTGLVGMCLGLLGGKVTLTDQSYVMDVLDYNIANIKKQADAAKKSFEVKTQEHVWGTDTSSLPVPEVVVGSDLIFAHEGIEPLCKSLKALVQKSDPKNPAVCYIAVIRRFEWENQFFKLMDMDFHSEVAHKDGDIVIYKYVWKAGKRQVDESKTTTSNKK